MENIDTNKITSKPVIEAIIGRENEDLPNKQLITSKRLLVNKAKNITNNKLNQG